MGERQPRGLTFYEVLGAFPEATPTQIKQAYRRAAKQWHPDKAHPKDKALAETKFKEIAEANEVLESIPLRKLYDIYLGCVEVGYVEVPRYDDFGQSPLKIPVTSWSKFRDAFETEQPPDDSFRDTAMNRQYEDDSQVDFEPPISCMEWIIAGGLFLVVWCWASRRHQHHAWLTALPTRIWETHVGFSLPAGLLLSPFFFGNVSFKTAAEWLQLVEE